MSKRQPMQLPPLLLCRIDSIQQTVYHLRRRRIPAASLKGREVRGVHATSMSDSLLPLPAATADCSEVVSERYLRSCNEHK